MQSVFGHLWRHKATQYKAVGNLFDLSVDFQTGNAGNGIKPFLGGFGVAGCTFADN